MSRKRNLKNDANRIFITENLTKTRTNLVKSLADLKYNQTSRPTGQRTVVSTQNLTKVADERSYGTMMTSETYLMPLTMI